MSASPSKAHMMRTSRHFRIVPKPEVAKVATYSICFSRRCLEWSIFVFPLIPRRYRRQDIPVLNYFSVLDPKQIVERSRPRREITLRQHKYKVALGHETTRGEIQLPALLSDTRNPIP